MAQVTVRINGYAYTVGCEDGQEPHLTAMAAEVEARIDSIKAIGGQSGEGRLLVLSALLLADELHDMKLELAQARTGRPGHGRDPALGPKLSKLARRAEEIAATIESA